MVRFLKSFGVRWLASVGVFGTCARFASVAANTVSVSGFKAKFTMTCQGTSWLPCPRAAF
jgi:hypothetical protein